jgi:lipopolysaccharide/colanic/teichoic acid biosynthesis glycosyltransferase
MLKRLFDIIFSLTGIIISSPFSIAVSLMIKLDSRGPVFYRAPRAGKFGKPFKIYKFRTMVVNADKLGGPSTSADDPRLTKFGKFLRTHNLDELPQLINILKGEMSFVGPRPEIPSEIDTYSPETKKVILSVKPGMTDLATLANLHEEEILKGSSNPHQTYREKIKPEKIRLGVEYVRKQSFWLDIKILIKTLLTALS